MATKTEALKPGERIPFAVPGTNVVVTVQATDTGTYTVTTYQGTYRVEDWCSSFATETEARFEATRAARAFHAHKTDVGIERRRNELGAVITYQEGRKLRRMCDHAALAKAYAEANAPQDFATAAVARKLAADLAKLYAA
jgi:hypothetical protein